MSPAEPRRTSRLSLWGPVLALMALIFVASSIPSPGPLPGGLSDKAAHAIGYGLLGGTLLRAFARGRLEVVSWRRGLAAIAVALLYGVADEYHQQFVPGRSSDVRDIVADVTGASLAVALGSAAAAARAWGILNIFGSDRQ